jgi:hypothetical protein
MLEEVMYMMDGKEYLWMKKWDFTDDDGRNNNAR